MNGWTAERRLRQAQMIKSWRPWERATGPRSAEGKAIAARNAFKGGERPMMRTFRSLLREQDTRRKEAFVSALERRYFHSKA